MKDVKVLLKEARDAIKNKDFNSSLKLCKSILKEDKSNYMGLVFLGLSLQEVGPTDQAPKAFQKAIQENKTNPLAWNGLINYYEKSDNDEAKKQLLQCYISIIDLETVDNKILQYCEKIANLCELGDVIEAAKVMQKVSKKENLSEDCSSSVKEVLVSLLEKLKDVPTELNELYGETLMTLINDQKTVRTEYYLSYISLLYKQKKHEEVITWSQKMLKTYENNVMALTWICKEYNQLYVEGDKVIEKIGYLENYYQQLLNLDANNAMGLFSKSVLLLKENKILEAKEILTEVLKARPGLIYARFLLSEMLVNLYLFDEAYQSLIKGEVLLKSISYSNSSLKSKYEYLMMEISSNSDSEEIMNKGLDLFNEIKDVENKTTCYPLLIKININLKKYVESKIQITELENSNKQAAKSLLAKMYVKQEKYQEALEVLEAEIFNSFDYWFELGLIYWKTNFKKCLEPFLKAAKCNQNIYLSFLYLGNFYQKVEDFDKSRRCYEKAFKLNTACSEAGIELSKMYMKLKKWDANLALLQNLTMHSVNTNNCWAWMQLGLNYLEQQEYDLAIENLRFVIRVDSENRHCWEALADAYFARGAYTSALKCYQKASDISEHALYPSLQVATIKQYLGEFEAARTDFEEILLKNGQYVLALKGLAETCFYQAKVCYREQRLGTARDHAQYASDKIVIAIQQKSELSCLWKILADCCHFVAKLPEKYCCLMVSKAVVESKDAEGRSFLEMDDLYSFATKCYCKAVSLTQDNVLLWHDLATCYLNHALHSEKESQKEGLFQYAQAVAEHCTSVNPSNWQHWNLLGNIFMNQEPPNYSRAQHSFIKAVTVDHNAASSWCNLGVIYLTFGKFKLANKAFAQGQRADPNYINSWIGQAFIAENMGHEDAMDLFRHSTQLGVSQQGALGYGHWVCQTILKSKPNEHIYAIHNMHAVPVACDALTWYTEKNPSDSCAWNMLGLLRERMGLKISAEAAFKNAYRQTDKSHRDQARINYGRLLTKLEKYDKAIEIFQEVQEATSNSGSGLAVALFKGGYYNDAYTAYEQSLHWLADEETTQSEYLVALASMAYMFQDKQAARTILSQSIQLESKSPWSLYSSLALGLLHEELQLVTIDNLKHLKDKTDCLEHYSVLLCYVYLLQGQHKRAIKEITKLVHRHPDQPSVWLTLSVVLVKAEQTKKSASAAVKCASIAIKYGKNKIDLTKILCLVSEANLIAGNEKEARVAAQKAVHCYPNVPECWAVLTSSLKNNKKYENLSYFKTKNSFISDLNPSESLLKWFKRQ